MQGQAAWALQALTEGNAACQAELNQAGGVAVLAGLLHFPEHWNWTPVVGILKNVAAAERPLRQALLAEGTLPVLVDLLAFGRPILQVWILSSQGFTRRFRATPVLGPLGVLKWVISDS